MKNILQILILIFTSICLGQNSKFESATTNVRGKEYPKVDQEGRASFKIHAPEVKSMQIDLGKKYDMKKDAEGNWTVTTDPLSEGFHYYSLIIDGLAVADPSSETFYGMSRMASGIEIPFAGDEYYTIKDVPHGEIRIKKYFSKITNTWRQMYVYTPPGYDTNTTRKYPVLYILHGGGEDERGWATQGRTDIILDNLIADGKAEPMIIVMPDANIAQGAFGEEGLKEFESELTRVIIPFVESTYRVKNDPANRALAGLSMGGINTLYTGLHHTDMFSSLGVFSSGWIMPMQKDIVDGEYELMRENSSKINKNLTNFWISMGGKEDIAFANCQVMLSKFDDMGIKYHYSEHPGRHTWPVWRNNLYNFAPLLFK